VRPSISNFKPFRQRFGELAQVVFGWLLAAEAAGLGRDPWGEPARTQVRSAPAFHSAGGGGPAS